MGVVPLNYIYMGRRCNCAMVFNVTKRGLFNFANPDSYDLTMKVKLPCLQDPCRINYKKAVPQSRRLGIVRMDWTFLRSSVRCIHLLKFSSKECYRLYFLIRDKWMWRTSNYSTNILLGRLRQFNENRRRLRMVSTLRSLEFGNF